MTARLLCGDVLPRLAELPDASVHCVVTSPPYWGLRDYGVPGQLGLEKTPQEFVAKMVEVFREVRRVLRNDGTLWLNMGDSYAGSLGNHGVQNRGRGTQRKITSGSIVKDQAERNGDFTPPGARGFADQGLKPKDLVGIPWMLAFALRAEGWYLRQDIIWSKPNPMPESVTDRCTKAHEYLFLLSKSQRYYYDAEAIKEDCTADHTAGNNSHKGTTAYLEGAEEHRTNQGLVAYAQKTRKVKMPDGWDTGAGGHGSFHRNGREKGETRELGEDPTATVVKRNKRSVWEITPQPFAEAHFATFPEKLVEPCILAGSPAGGTVLDPFCGSGTVGVVALRYGREFVGIDLSPAYLAMAERRIRNDAPLLNLVETAP